MSLRSLSSGGRTTDRSIPSPQLYRPKSKLCCSHCDHLLFLLCSSLLGRKRASQGPVLSFSTSVKRQRIADPVKNVSSDISHRHSWASVCVCVCVCRTGLSGSGDCGIASHETLLWRGPSTSWPLVARLAAVSAPSLMSTVHTVEWTPPRSELPLRDSRSVSTQRSQSWVWSLGCGQVCGCGLCRSRGVRSLKVVVQRALIELPSSLRRRCSVEGGEGETRGRRRSRRAMKREPSLEQDDADSQLITCQSCDITVHRGEPPIGLICVK